MKLFKVISCEKTYWTLYNSVGEYQDLICAYLIHCVDDIELNASSTRARAYTLKNWAAYILQCNVNLLTADNDLIKMYRDHLLETKSTNASLNAKSRQRTINQYLKIIYDFYYWVQSLDKTRFILGSSEIYNIQSSLASDLRKKLEYEMYPLLFRRTASKSKHRTTYTPDYGTFLSLYRHFLSSCNAELAERNCLILKIALESGLRVGSIASLKIHDFNLQNIQSCGDHLQIVPEVQKFGMANSFSISLGLAMDIQEYINSSRKRIIERTLTKSDYVFLNMLNGSKLHSTSISSAFSKASKKLELPYRSGIHSWRGLFTENLIDYEIDARLELGFDASVESISMVVSKALGHSNPLSQQSYVRSMRSKHRSSQAFKHLQEISNLKAQLLHSCKEAEILRKEVLHLSCGEVFE